MNTDPLRKESRPQSAPKRTVRARLAEDRTEWAEDRTILASERTFAGWMRTGMSSVAIGLGFQAIFRDAEPTWLAKSAATLFIAIGVIIFAGAYVSSRKVLARLQAHEIEPLPSRHLALVCGALIAGSAVVGVILWLL